MAAKYWVGDGMDPLWGSAGNWSSTPGGAGGAGEPGVNDDVHFTSDNTEFCLIADDSVSIKSLTMGSGCGTVTMTDAPGGYLPVLTIAENMLLQGGTFTPQAGRLVKIGGELIIQGGSFVGDASNIEFTGFKNGGTRVIIAT